MILPKGCWCVLSKIQSEWHWVPNSEASPRRSNGVEKWNHFGHCPRHQGAGLRRKNILRLGCPNRVLHSALKMRKMVQQKMCVYTNTSKAKSNIWDYLNNCISFLSAYGCLYMYLVTKLPIPWYKIFKFLIIFFRNNSIWKINLIVS